MKRHVITVAYMASGTTWCKECGGLVRETRTGKWVHTK